MKIVKYILIIKNKNMKNNEITKNETISFDIIESLIINGDLSKLNQKQKVEYYQKYCSTLGLNPVTQPFQILKLNGKEKLYCGREGVAQLSKVHSVSHEIISTESISGVYIVKAKAFTGNRYTTSTGAVTIENLKGDTLCNAFMKAETKAKRRATLDLLGLGTLDDIEIETIPNAVTVEVNVKSIDEQIEEAKAKIITASNLDDLKTKWATLTKIEGKFDEVIELKNKLKSEFENVKSS